MRYIETIKIVNGKPCNMVYHQSRVHQTAATELTQIVIPQEFQIGVVKLRIVYSPSALLSTTFSHYKLPTINSLTLIEAPNIEYSKKYEDRTEIENLYAQRGENDDILIVQNGNLTDTSFCNIVLENNEGLFTPDTPLLAGTKRKQLIEKGIITPRRITINDLNNYHTIHLINAMIELEDNVSYQL